MKRSEINRYIREAIQFFESNHFYLPVWARWSTAEWQSKGCLLYTSPSPRDA